MVLKAFLKIIEWSEKNRMELLLRLLLREAMYGDHPKEVRGDIQKAMYAISREKLPKDLVDSIFKDQIAEARNAGRQAT